ncbi:hypothetical protein B7R22_13795 [Subtercola boreus]|uniref:Uncharacterized protein n=1 Tax=Subtercola boreus TaxID=120213 RepID=A0A3E0VUF5_9MICO|nr:hypothetical protein [Subtercola boreus]RFA13235.1 hypothetical protein B7R22_13795 [Subtercola boreus]
MISRIDLAAFSKLFEDELGTLPDGEVEGATAADWDRVLAALRATGWRMTLQDGSTPLPASVAELPIHDSFAVWPASRTRINFFPGPDGVFFDVDLRELEVQRSVDGLSDLMRCLGTATGRNVVLRSDPDRVAPKPHNQQLLRLS